MVWRELRLPSRAIDLDLPGDVAQFLARVEGGRHTRALLRELAWGSPGGPGTTTLREDP